MLNLAIVSQKPPQSDAQRSDAQLSIMSSTAVSKQLITHHKVAGFDALIALIGTLTGGAGESPAAATATATAAATKQPINVYFSGAVDAATGRSWCPDCVEAEPHVAAALERVAEPTHYVYCDVGDRTFWKDARNAFRTDRRTQLSVIPALLRWGDVRRLDGEQLLKADLLDMFFNED